MRVCALGAATLLYTMSQPTAAIELSLEGSGWKLSKLSRGGGGVNDAEAQVVVANATVPGGVWDNLHRANLIGDPLYRENDLVFANVTTQGPDIYGWTFSKAFDCPAVVAAGSQAVGAVLEFGGLQTLANVTVNGQRVLTADNMFRLQRASIPRGLLKASGNTLSVALTATPMDPGPLMTGGTNCAE
jgi:beta-galactosidase/beta-glucuronidase